MNAPQNEHELLDLFSAVRDERATPEQWAWLLAAIAEESRVQVHYLEFMAVEAALESHAAKPPGLDALNAAPLVDYLRVFESASAQPTTSPSAKPSGAIATVSAAIEWDRHPVRLLATAAALTAVIWAGWLTLIAPGGTRSTAGPTDRSVAGEPDRFVAKIVESHGARWDDPDGQLFDGANLPPNGRIRLAEGQALLHFKQGAEVTLAGPAELVLVDANTCRLDIGRLEAKVPGKAIGFEVQTPSCRIVDLGTEFGVLVAHVGMTEVHVSRGQVATWPAGQEAQITLRAGQALRLVGAGQAPERITQRRLVAAAPSPGSGHETGRSIGLNFTNKNGPTFSGQVERSDSPGIVAGTHWNNVAPRGKNKIDRDLVADIVSPTAGAVVDNRGAVVSALTATYSYGNASLQGVEFPTTSFLRMMNGQINGNSSVPSSVRITGIPFAAYDAYVYVGVLNNDHTMSVTDGTTTYYFRNRNVTYPKWITSATADRPTERGNFAVFAGLSAPALQLRLDGSISGTTAACCHGIHLVEVDLPTPDPGRPQTVMNETADLQEKESLVTSTSLGNPQPEKP